MKTTPLDPHLALERAPKKGDVLALRISQVNYPLLWLSLAELDEIWKEPRSRALVGVPRYCLLFPISDSATLWPTPDKEYEVVFL